MAIPAYVQRFRNALLDAQVEDLNVGCCSPTVGGEHGIPATSKIKYNNDEVNLLGREHEYTFHLPSEVRVQVSIQLYLNEHNQWRLFAFNDRGMLFSVNLTLERKEKDVVTLAQVLSIKSHKMDSEQRARIRGELVHCLRSLQRSEIDHRNCIYFGTFDGRDGTFLDTTANDFMRDFTISALIKGHFMQNKSYKLPGLHYEKFAIWGDAASTRGLGRSIPGWLRYQVLERDRRCLLCGATTDDTKLHVDHIIPWSQGGPTELDNLQTLCARCNLGKGNRATDDFR